MSQPAASEPVPKTVIVTGASSGFGRMISRALATAGHTVYGGMRGITDKNADAAAEADKFAADNGVTLRTVEMDVSDQESVDAGVATVIGDTGKVDVVVHNAGHMVLGPVEAFTVEEVAAMYDTNVLSTQRLNKAVLPLMRARGEGLLVWIGSTSTRGGTPPYLGPYFAAKAAEDALAVSLAAELIRFGIDTTIVVPGSFTTGTNHFANAGHPGDTDVAKEYEEKYAGLMDQVTAKLNDLAPEDADPEEVARSVVAVVAAPSGARPFRVHVDPAQDGAEVVNAVGDHVRREFYRRIDLEDLLPAGLQ